MLYFSLSAPNTSLIQCVPVLLYAQSFTYHKSAGEGLRLKNNCFVQQVGRQDCLLEIEHVLQLLARWRSPISGA